MNDPTLASKANAPWHLWLVGVLALLWNSVGAFDYVMTQSRNASYMRAFASKQLTYYADLPMWVVSTWALSVWGGVLGSALLLLRRRLAVPAFSVSLITFLVTSFHTYILADGFAILGGAGALVFTAIIFVIAVGLLIYARLLTRRGVLR